MRGVLRSSSRELVARIRWQTFTAAAALALAVIALASGPTHAQSVFQQTSPKSMIAGKGQPNAKQMFVTADEMRYDYENDRVSAVGNVQIYHDGSVLQADKVTFDRNTNTVTAEGSVRLESKDHSVIHANRLELTQDLKKGFIDSLRLDGADQTHFAAAQADRRDGDITVMRSGVYTACAPCKDDPKKPPLWQVRAARIIHKEGERMVYYEDATVEFFGLPIAYFPHLSHPDPTVRRKSGWLIPHYRHTTEMGSAVDVPYFWAMAPNYDLTLTPTVTTRQGLLMQAEWRHRLINGSYDIRAAGIRQADKDQFLGSTGNALPGYRDWRGTIMSTGQFLINKNWHWGWNGVLMSDRMFFSDYNLTREMFRKRDISSNLYLTGLNDRAFFDVRTIYYTSLLTADQQKTMPFVHPVLDYNYTFGPSVAGGELGYNINFTSLSRSDGTFQQRTTAKACSNTDPLSVDTTNCLMRGAPGLYTRLSAELNWKRSFIEQNTGQVFTPFFSLRGDVAWRDTSDRTQYAGFVDPNSEMVTRAMPTAGLEYRWPFISVSSWGTQTLEPVAQLILRPSETRIGAMPNEDAQSLVFDDTNLFKIDKFSGYDRIEGGARANVGIRYNAFILGGGTLNALFGQSYHLFGVNSFAQPDMANTGLDSGLETKRSDYVARVNYEPNTMFKFGTRLRLDEQDFSLKRFEVEGAAKFERLKLSAIYGRYAPQPELGYLTRREAILGGASLKLTPNWEVSTLLRYDLENDRVNGANYGISYIDECFGLGLNYITDRLTSGDYSTVHKIMLRLDLRTVGESAVTSRVGGTNY